MKIFRSNSLAQATNSAILEIVSQLRQNLEDGKNCLWLLSGGSAVGVEVAVAKTLGKAEKAAVNIAQVDERFVPIGSSNQNWQQLFESGFPFSHFKHSLAMIKPKLSKEEAALQYAAELDETLLSSQFSIGLYGIGVDGHTAGIKPMSNDVGFLPMQGPQLVVAYQGKDFARITTTAAVIARLDSIVVFAPGKEKSQVIEKLQQKVPVYKMPAQLLKQARKLVVFN